MNFPHLLVLCMNVKLFSMKSPLYCVSMQEWVFAHPGHTAMQIVFSYINVGEGVCLKKNLIFDETYLYMMHVMISVVFYMRSFMPETGIKARDKLLHPTDTSGCNYLSLSLITVSGITLLIKGRDKQLHSTDDVGHNYLLLSPIPASGTTLLISLELYTPVVWFSVISYISFIMMPVTGAITW